MTKGGGKIAGPQCLQLLDGASFLALKTSKIPEIIGPSKSDSLIIDDKPSGLGLDSQVPLKRFFSVFCYLYLNIQIQLYVGDAH